MQETQQYTAILQTFSILYMALTLFLYFWVCTADSSSSRPPHVFMYELQQPWSRWHGSGLQPDQNPTQTESPPQPLHAVCQVRGVFFCFLLTYCYTRCLTLTGALALILQGAAQRTQRQPGHYGEAGDLQWAVQCQESQQHAGPPHSAAAQPRAGSKGKTRDFEIWIKSSF